MFTQIFDVKAADVNAAYGEIDDYELKVNPVATELEFGIADPNNLPSNNR